MKVLALLASLLAASCALPEPAQSGDRAVVASAAPRCDERMGEGTGLVPRFCVDLPATVTAASASDALPASCVQGFFPAPCEEPIVPELRGAGGASGASGGDLVCGEATAGTLAPRFCVTLPTQPTAAGDASRPGTAELERGTGKSFAAAGDARAHLFLETSLPAADRERLARTFADTVADVERSFQHTFVRAPAVYVFATSATFERGLTVVFGYPASVASALSREHGGVLLPGADAALVNWESAGGNMSIMRHELTHAAIREIAGAGRVPAWLDEGLATLTHDLDDDQTSRRDRYAMRSLVESGRVRLATLTFSGPLTRYEYIAAQEAADMLLGRIGSDALGRMLAVTGAGTPFAQAFADAGGGSLASFVESFPRELRARLPTPTIFTATPRANRDVTWIAYGFAPSADATVTVVGDDYRLTYVARSDAFGAVSGTFGSTAPAGTYLLSVGEGSTQASATLRTTG